jgi:hypothetical protein
VQPKHKHDCESCKFLGRHEPTNADLYYHPGSPGGETIIARYGSEGSNYTSGWPFADGYPELQEAERLAKSAGYVEPDFDETEASHQAAEAARMRSCR